MAVGIIATFADLPGSCVGRTWAAVYRFGRLPRADDLRFGRSLAAERLSV